MRKANYAVYIVTIFLGLSLPIGAEVVQAKERFLTVKFKDGYTERYKVKWQALRDMTVQEHGGPAKPLEGKFVDDRRCEWNINARIERRFYLVARNGETFAKEEAFRSYNSDFQNQGSSFLLIGLRSENCNDAASRRQSDWNNTQTKLLNAFGGITNADFDNVKAEMKKDAQVVEISEK